MTTVLVTGGAGFIGSHLSQELINKGYKVRVLDNLSSGKLSWVPKQADFIQGDIGHLETCHHAMQGVTGVFHCAAMSRVALSFESIDLCTEVNIRGTQNILLAARDAGVKKLIYSGSSTYYGNQPPPHCEYDTPSHLLNFYALSKVTGEQYCLLFDKLFNLPCVILRYFNVYGPRQPSDGAYGLVLGCFLQKWRQQESLVIHGTGEQRRDFIHVHDVARANIIAFESNVRHDIFNIGSGTNISIKELANMISPHHIHENKRPGDAEVTLADISRVKALLNWEPTITLQEGLSQLIIRQIHYHTESEPL